MAENPSQDEKTEEPTQERRDDFREKGQIAMSKEITSVFVFASVILFLALYAPKFIAGLAALFTNHFQQAAQRTVTPRGILDFAITTWTDVVLLIVPMFVVTAIIAVAVTLVQTRFSWSWKRLNPDFSRMNILKGLARLVGGQAAMELFKGVGKMSAIGLVSWLILSSEWSKVPGLMMWSVSHTWGYWGEITQYLFWAVSALLLLVAGADYIFNYQSLERQMRMTKQEVKEEFKKRETDPQIKARMRRLQREMLTRKALEATQEATVIITNPTHYSVALKYELGMSAPIVVAKGIDHLALLIREKAKELDIPLVENRPLARELFAVVEEGEEIPDRLYKIVAEIIRYVFRIKGRPVKTAKPSAEVTGTPTGDTIG